MQNSQILVDLSTNSSPQATTRCANPECDELFDPSTPRQKYHNPSCQRGHYSAKHSAVAYPDLTTGTVGTIGELRVATDLLTKGYDVFRSVSTNCWTDLVVNVDGKFLSVEVKTGRRAKNGGIQHPKPKTKTDVLAIVLPNEIVYQPEI